MTENTVVRPGAQVVVSALACVLLVAVLLLPLPELDGTPQPHFRPATKLEPTLTTVENTSDETPQRPATKLEPTLTTAKDTSDGRTRACGGARIPPQALQTCAGRRLEAGYVLVLSNWEQQTAGSANLMSLQCWAATLKMVVVEYFMATSEYRIPDELLVNASTASPNKFVRLRQLYDIDYWNQYSRSKCYAPLVKWEEFLCNAPREVILVHIAYQDSKSAQSCPPHPEYNNFLDAHGFKIYREICLEASGSRSTRTFNSLIWGNVTSMVTVIIDDWRGIAKGMRIYVSDSQCNRGQFLSQPFARPSTMLLEHVRLYREQVLKNKDYIAVMVRLELAVRPIHHKRALYPSQCMKGISSTWRDLKESNNSKETFWSFDVGTYGSVGYSRGAAGGYNYINKLFTYMEQFHNVSYPRVEENLASISGICHEGYNAAASAAKSRRMSV